MTEKTKTQELWRVDIQVALDGDDAIDGEFYFDGKEVAEEAVTRWRANVTTGKPDDLLSFGPDVYGHSLTVRHGAIKSVEVFGPEPMDTPGEEAKAQIDEILKRVREVLKEQGPQFVPVPVSPWVPAPAPYVPYTDGTWVYQAPFTPPTWSWRQTNTVNTDDRSCVSCNCTGDPESHGTRNRR